MHLILTVNKMSWQALHRVGQAKTRILKAEGQRISWPEIADIWARTSERGFLLESKEWNNMAANKRFVPKVDYKQLNALSSVVLFDTSTKKVKGRKIYDVERIIERRKAKYVRFP